MHPDRLTDLYRRYGPAIYARCRTLLADESAAEDATQETFLRVQRHLDRVPSAREALYWIYRVATNYCLNELRNRRSRALPHADLLDLHESHQSHRSHQSHQPIEGIDANESRLADQDLARRLIERARPNVRLVAWLYHVDGFEQEEVAAIVGISRRTVATRLAQFSSNARKFVRRSAA